MPLWHWAATFQGTKVHITSIVASLLRFKIHNQRVGSELYYVTVSHAMHHYLLPFIFVFNSQRVICSTDQIYLSIERDKVKYDIDN